MGSSVKFPSKIDLRSLIKYSGEPQELVSFDVSIRNICTAGNYPAFTGGTVTGSIDEEWEYVPFHDPAGKSNYIFGKRFCAAVASKLEGNAKIWWDDYCNQGKPEPNCWRQARFGSKGDGSRPLSVEEVSMFDLLNVEFSAEDDQQAAILQLKRLRWDPTKPDALPQRRTGRYRVRSNGRYCTGLRRSITTGGYFVVMTSTQSN